MTVRTIALAVAALLAGSHSGLAANAATIWLLADNARWPAFTGRSQPFNLSIAAVQNPPVSPADSATARPPDAGQDFGAASHPDRSAALVFTGRGTQVYRCQNTGSAYAWVLERPDAQLFDAAGQLVGQHFFGPRWEANDGSRIVGQLLAASASPDGRGNVPWLVLRARIEQADGIFGHVRIITRTNTQGGVAPAAPCGPEQNDQVMHEVYAATYTFFPDPKAAGSQSRR
jgi:hypothetical protein